MSETLEFASTPILEAFISNSEKVLRNPQHVRTQAKRTCEEDVPSLGDLIL
jgi:hypothetical protein